MGNTPKTRNRRFRTKNEIVADITYVLNAPLHYGTQEAVLRDACWVWTEYSGKYDGCEYWSKDAKIQELRHLKHQIDSQEISYIKRIHEHVVPKRVVCKMLRELSPAMPESVREICDRFLHGVVVTLEEDAKLNQSKFRQTMPAEFFDPASPEYHDPWLRYKRCGIELIPRPPSW
jgi:hypothetical protein